MCCGNQKINDFWIISAVKSPSKFRIFVLAAGNSNPSFLRLIFFKNSLINFEKSIKSKSVFYFFSYPVDIQLIMKMMALFLSRPKRV
jgi:hypothetical protein